MALTVFTSLVGFWGHRFAPLHFYDPAVSWTDAGEISTNWGNVKKYLDESMTIEQYGITRRILTDDVYAASLVVPVDQLDKMRVVGMDGNYSLEPDTMVLLFRDLQLLSYVKVFYGAQPDPAKEEEFRRTLEAEANLVYEDGLSSVWLR
jgi:hypothetical protein